MKKLILIFFALLSIHAIAQNNQDFIVKPYLQVGSKVSTQSLQLLWHGSDSNDNWTVQYKVDGKGKWLKVEKITNTRIAVVGLTPFKVYNASFTALVPGGIFTYRVSKNGAIVFNADAKAPKSIDQPYRLVVFGDIGAGTKEAKEIANEVYKSNADLVAVTGDIVYDNGTISDYASKFWPIYNSDTLDEFGAPLLRSIPFVGAVGNHDAETRDLDKYPDALAYYNFWDQPLNGPVGIEGGSLVPELKGSDANKKAFTDPAGDKYPRMTNFSFNYGNAHYLILDSDTYVDWTDPTLRAWVEKDLADSKEATWRFVFYHHPGFSSSIDHFEQQQMRLLSPIFEKGNVDVVFNGHVHNYQRTFPMYFAPDKNGTLLQGKDSKSTRGRVVNGLWTIDKYFNGKTNTKPNGVIYIVTGAGGQDLYDVVQNDKPDSWQKFTNKFISYINSFTVVDVKGNTLKLKQIGADGKEIDAFEISK